jgi:hypothetical protein
MPAGPLSRLFRAVGFATACVALSAAGHELMSGEPIPTWALSLGALALLPPVYALAYRQRGYPSIAAAMLAGELGLHELFAWAQRGMSAATHVTGGTGWLSVATCGGGRVLVPVRGDRLPAGSWPLPAPGGASGMAAMPGMSGMRDLPSGGHGALAMIAAHVIAGLLCAWWLRTGEAAAFGLLWTMAMSLLAPLSLIVAWRPVSLSPRRVGPPAHSNERPRHGLLLADTMVRRGPPPVFADI